MNSIRMAKSPKFNKIENTRMLQMKNDAKFVMKTKMYDAMAPIECRNDDGGKFIDDGAIAL